MKVVHITRFYYPHIGGNENQARLLLASLTKDKDVHLVLITSNFDGKQKLKVEINNVSINRLSHYVGPSFALKNHILEKIVKKVYFLVSEYSFLWVLYLNLRKQIKDADLIHVHQTSWLSLIPTYLAKKYGKPIIIKEATLNGFQFLKALFLPKFFKTFILKYAHFIAVSTMIRKDLLKQGANHDHVHLIPNGIYVNIDDVGQKYFKNNKKILFIGNFSHGPIKGLDILLRAMIYVNKEISDARLEIIGEGDKAQYESLIKTNGLEHNVFFRGKQKNILGFYKDTNVFVLPSRSEGMSNSLLEAMGYGIPCVATNVSGVEDIIDNGKNGFIVNKGDYYAIADRIIILLKSNNLCEKFSIQAKEKTLKKFDIYKIAEHYHKLYLILIKQNGEKAN